MRIGELCRRTGVSARMLRYYEAQGLLAPSRRPSGYRDYAEPDVSRVQHVRDLLAAGLSTATIAAGRAAPGTDPSHGLDRRSGTGPPGSRQGHRHRVGTDHPRGRGAAGDRAGRRRRALLTTDSARKIHQALHAGDAVNRLPGPRTHNYVLVVRFFCGVLVVFHTGGSISVERKQANSQVEGEHEQ